MEEALDTVFWPDDLVDSRSWCKEIILGTRFVCYILLQLRLIYSLHSKVQFDLSKTMALSLMDLFERHNYLAAMVLSEFIQ